MENPTELHLQAAKRVIRYLKVTTNFGIFYKKGGDDNLVTYVDSDYASDLKDRKSISSYVFLLRSRAISCLSKNLVMHARTKHIDVHFHCLYELTKVGIVELVHCSTEEQLIDATTQPLTLNVFLKLQGPLGAYFENEVN
ncbi:hypothetical protein FEM48_Zijuj04G0138600 [Ziziphus jujuba var. spinosa]|uniref:Uncharacterized protein n=1 Tax=Ziziphus jujuba var. spinosa TaxID=714518 RepID=A0A978VK91_ZIZJJ|nr:hypothetical protein FEM48_Zijuj04G0138600 [Ziziphus jujuba var. spinosa]